MSIVAKMSTDKRTLKLEIPIEGEPRPSASGKTLVVATSHGNQPTTLQVNGRPLMVGVNAFIKPA